MKFEEAPEIITPKIKLDGSDKLLANKYAVRRWSIQNMIYDPTMFYENLKES